MGSFTFLIDCNTSMDNWFSTPVFAWWATSNEYFGLQTTKRQGEWMLIAGMLSTFPALVINSLISPIIITFLGISMDGVESLGYGMILFLSAPIGEELSKALAIYSYLDSLIQEKEVSK